MLGYKRYTTIIMDGSNEKTVNEIIGIIDMITRRRIGKSKCRNLDSDHPTMKVIRTFASANTYQSIKRVIEKTYPGLCVFKAIV